MTLDFLCPGDWQDSYESRIVNPNAMLGKGGYCVENIADLFNVCKMFNRDNVRYYDLFANVDIYLDGELKASLRKDGTLRIFAPCETKVTHDDILLCWSIGKEDFIFDVTSCRYVGRA